MSDDGKSIARKAIEIEMIKSQTGLRNLAPILPQGSTQRPQNSQSSQSAQGQSARRPRAGPTTGSASKPE